MLSLVSSFREVLFFFLSSPHHIGGSSRVAEAMSEVEQDPLNQSKTDEEKKSNPPGPKRSRSPHRKDQALVGGSIAGGPLLPQEVLECPSRGSRRMRLSHPTHRSFLLRPLRRGGRSQESFGRINRRLPRTTSRTKAAIRPQRHTVGKKPQTRRGKCYMQLTATADLSEAFRQLPTPMIKRGR